MNTETQREKYRAIENFHIVLWLIKDLCWCMLWKHVAIFMIIPTFIFAIFITYNGRKSRSDLFHNLAVMLWIVANSVWMIGEFYFHEGLNTVAFIFFILGLLLVAYYYITHIFFKESSLG